MAAIEGIGALYESGLLAAFLAGQQWRRLFSERTLSKATDYTRPQRLLELRVERSSRGEVRAEATFVGKSFPSYETLVVFRPRKRGSAEPWETLTECSCPVSSRCKHAAAVLMALTEAVCEEEPELWPPGELRSTDSGEDEDWDEALDDAGDDEPDGPLAVPGAARDSEAVRRWLGRIREAAAAAAGRGAAAMAAGHGPARFLAYGLHRPRPGRDSGRFRMSLHVGRRNRDGTVVIDFRRNATANPDNPPSYLTREDVPVAFLFRRLRRFAWSDREPLLLAGRDGGELLRTALATGRLFLVPSEAGERPVPLEAAPACTVALEWREHPEGLAPALGGIGSAAIVPVEPPMALDMGPGTLASLEAGDVPDGLLVAWAEGPLVPHELVEEVTAGLATAPASTTLPTPREVETRPVPGKTAPAPSLTVRRISVDLTYGPPDVFLVGEVRFAYGDSPPLAPLDSRDPKTTSVVIGGVRWVVPRDFPAERARRKRLREFDLVPLHELAGPLVVRQPPEVRFAVLPEDPFPTPEVAWVNFLLGGDAATLRAEGWTIEVDPDAGVSVREIDDFITDLESESGVDWFRFDAGFEVDGRRVSLIPLIADVFASGRGIPDPEDPELPEWFLAPDPEADGGFLRIPARRFAELLQSVRHLFVARPNADEPLRLHRLEAADLAEALDLDETATARSLRTLGRALRDFTELPTPAPPESLHASLRPYQLDGFHWFQFLARHELHGILADDMGLGKTIQTLTHLLAEKSGGHDEGKPSLVIAPTSVVPNWASEAERFVPTLRALVLHGPERFALFDLIPQADLVITSYALLARDFETLAETKWHTVILDEAQHIKNPRAKVAQLVCRLEGAQRICLSGTPVENHLGELWSLMRFLMPGYLGDSDTFRRVFRTPIEKRGSEEAQSALNRRVAPLLLRRTKDEVAAELPAKTEIIHRVALGRKQADLYESVRAAMDQRVREAVAARGLAKSHIIVLDALLKLRQICCHPQLLKTPAAGKVDESAKLDHLTRELLPTLLEDGRRILLFSQFTTMLALIEKHLVGEGIGFVKLTGRTRDRRTPVRSFQEGEVPLFLISLKAGGTGLNLTAADTVIHYDPWWNPAVENQATDRAHRIGQDKPVFVHKLVCEGTIEERIHELQSRKSALVEALLDDSTSRLRIDRETLENLLAPIVP